MKIPGWARFILTVLGVVALSFTVCSVIAVLFGYGLYRNEAVVSTASALSGIVVVLLAIGGAIDGWWTD